MGWWKAVDNYVKRGLYETIGERMLDVKDVSEWTVIEKSTGSRVGYWIIDFADVAGKALVKLPRVHQPSGFVRGEVWAEMLASLIGKSLDLSVPEVEVVRFHGRKAALVWNFCPPEYELKEGADLTGTLLDEAYLTLEDVYTRLTNYVDEGEAISYLVRMVCFDILIGNPDRHQRNWGVLISSVPGESVRTAPLYDNAAALGSNLDELRVHELLAGGWGYFDRHFRYPIAVEPGRKSTMEELLNKIAALDPGWAGFREKLRWLDDVTIRALIDNIGCSEMTLDRRKFVFELLRHRRDLILKRV